MKCYTTLGRIGFIPIIFLLVVVHQNPVVSQEGRLEEIQVRSEGLADNLLDDMATRNVTVYIPGEYDNENEKRYPVVYLLHGYTGNNTLWTGGSYIEDLNVTKIMDKLIASGDVEPMILVAPDGHNAFRGCWYTNSPVTGNWEDFVVKDLVCHIDAMYRTIPKRTSRAIVGHSMGGHGAIKIAMKHPEVYCALYAMSPAAVDFHEMLKKPFTKDFIAAAETKKREALSNLHWRAQAMIALAAAVAPNPNAKPFFGELPLDSNGVRVEAAWKRWLEHDLSTTMLAKYRDNLRRYKAIVIDGGTKEDLLPSIKAFVKALKEAGVNHAYEEFDGTHTDHVTSQLEYKVLPLFSVTLQHSELVPAATGVR